MMMLYLYVQQNQWIAITLLAGIALTFVLCLLYLAMWQPRGAEGEAETIEVKDLKTCYRWLRSFVPWAIVIAVVISIAFTIATLLAKSSAPPNW